MKRLSFEILILLILLFPSYVIAAGGYHKRAINHDLKVVIYPQEHRFTAQDRITVPDDFPSEFRFLLHKGLNPSSQTKGVTVVMDDKKPLSEIVESFLIRLPRGLRAFVLSYSGIINHPLEQYGKEQARGYSQTTGKISGAGVYLSGSSYWYPVFSEDFVTFSLHVELPPGWDAVSQGERTTHIKNSSKTSVRWESPEPQEEVFLIAGQFHEYLKSSEKLQAMVFLRSPEKGLAEKYLDATVRYINMYENLIGPYPYKKFALIENFWETGFGMPSFTLLGPKVIRFPFIITTSYPHEILHTWWGNSVYPVYEKGNWAEGLTAYLSDHLLKEQQGEGAEYRRTTLQKYTDYVAGSRDFPLTEFRSRHSASSEAIGYGKSLMFFHMLRQQVGDSIFIEGLRDFYRRNVFSYATFTELRKSFEHVSRKNLGTEFDQWITKPGAPELKVSGVKVNKRDGKYILAADITQVQQGDAYLLRVPVVVTLEGQDEAYQTSVVMEKKYLEMGLSVASRPVRIDIDPESDLFRRLDRYEIPPAITQALGSRKMVIILPSAVSASLLDAYKGFANSLGNFGPDEVRIISDKDVNQLPSDSAVCILGRENRFYNDVINSLSLYGVIQEGEGLHVGKSVLPFYNHSIVLTARNLKSRDTAILFITSDTPGALPGLSRKLPHYHSYSYLGFKGAEPENIAKGRWPVIDSPMTVFIPREDGAVSKAGMGKLSVRKPLAPSQPVFSSEKMIETVRFLSDDALRGRAAGTKEIDVAAEYIAEKFKEAGLHPAGDTQGSYFQVWEEETGRGSQKMIMKNIIGVIPGQKLEWAEQSVIVGAHYDHLCTSVTKDGKEQIFHGADDNASGVSVLLELARVFGKNLKPDRNIVFAAFTGEESDKRGSRHYIGCRKKYPIEQSIGMLNLDTVGRLGQNKLMVIGASSAKEWMHIFRGAEHLTGVGIVAASEDLDSSDQKIFRDAGVPAIQLFSGPHPDYHKPSDTVDKIDTEGLVKVASVAKEVIEYLAARQEPLTVTIETNKRGEPEQKKERRVSFGIIPDFTFNGSGCRVSGIVRGSPAEKAGLREGDIITKIDSLRVGGLKDFSSILKSLNPGDRVSVTYMRDGKEVTAEAELSGK